MSDDKIVIELNEEEAQEFITLIRRIDAGMQQLCEHFGLEPPERLEPHLQRVK